MLIDKVLLLNFLILRLQRKLHLFLHIEQLNSFVISFLLFSFAAQKRTHQ